MQRVIAQLPDVSQRDRLYLPFEAWVASRRQQLPKAVEWAQLSSKVRGGTQRDARRSSRGGVDGGFAECRRFSRREQHKAANAQIMVCEWITATASR